jgi:predicted dithiol-disulfide oxidoreductase (DUF899 family)
MSTQTKTFEERKYILDHEIVSPENWVAMRKELLKKEKEFTRLGDQLSAEKRKLPWVKVGKEYVFDGPDGKETLADLFSSRSQLVVYHFMFGPEWEEGCPTCSLVADNFDSNVVHLAHRDVTLTVVSRARLPQIEAFKKRMGWRFKWVSSYGSDFNHDYRVSFTNEEMVNGDYYNYDTSGFHARRPPASACSIRTRPATSSTPIPATHVDRNF